MNQHGSTSTGPTRVVVVGAGRRSRLYAAYGLCEPDRLKVVAVVDPHVGRRDALADAHAVPAEARIETVEKFLASDVQVDAAINGTMDKLHHATALPLINPACTCCLKNSSPPQNSKSETSSPLPRKMTAWS